MLRALLRYSGKADPSVMVGPAFGVDAAVIDLGRSDYLILKSDPVTFTTLELGWYVVHVNANDVAVMGGRPRWFQSTIIVPPGTVSDTVQRIMREIHAAARQLGIAVTGGHTEVSAAVRQPIVAGDMQGLVARRRLILPTGARPGDVLVMTKSAGIEGTAILARERPGDARQALGTAGQRQAAHFHHEPGLSVVRDAAIAAAHGVHAMHDPTEGGVAAGLFEMAMASRCRFLVDVDAIPIHAHTQRLCTRFGLRPLGLIGSGALLASVPPSRVRGLRAALAAQRIPATMIGQVVAGSGVTGRRNGKLVRFEWSERDELTRLE